MERDQLIGLVGEVGSDLLENVLAQGARPRCSVLEPRTVVGDQRPVPTMPSLGLLGKVEGSVALYTGCGMPVFTGIDREITG